MTIRIAETKTANRIVSQNAYQSMTLLGPTSISARILALWFPVWEFSDCTRAACA